MCQAAIPKLREGGRIVNLSSVGCKLENYSKPIQDRFRKAYDGMTLNELEELVQEYETSFKKGTTKQDGWPFQKPYCVSKAAVTGKSSLLQSDVVAYLPFSFYCYPCSRKSKVPDQLLLSR